MLLGKPAARKDMETLAAIREGIASAERGELKPPEQISAEMQARYGIQR